MQMQTSPRLRMSQKTKTKIGFVVIVIFLAAVLNVGLFFYSPPLPVVLAMWVVVVVLAAGLVNKSAVYLMRRKFSTQAPSVLRSPESATSKQEKIRHLLELEGFTNEGNWVMQTPDQSNLVGTVVLMSNTQRTIHACVFDGPIHIWSSLEGGRTLVTSNLKEISARDDIIFHRVPKADVAQVVGKHLAEIDHLASDGVGIVTDDLPVDRRFELEERRGLAALGWMPEHLVTVS